MGNADGYIAGLATLGVLSIGLIGVVVYMIMQANSTQTEMEMMRMQLACRQSGCESAIPGLVQTGGSGAKGDAQGLRNRASVKSTAAGSNANEGNGATDDPALLGTMYELQASRSTPLPVDPDATIQSGVLYVDGMTFPLNQREDGNGPALKVNAPVGFKGAELGFRGAELETVRGTMTPERMAQSPNWQRLNQRSGKAPLSLMELQNLQRTKLMPHALQQNQTMTCVIPDDSPWRALKALIVIKDTYEKKGGIGVEPGLAQAYEDNNLGNVSMEALMAAYEKVRPMA